MFKKLRLGNFKAFGEEQTIPFKPITLIFGPNSSGKSSIIHSLVYLHHALKTGNLDVVHTEKGGDSIDLGGIKQCVFKHDLKNRIVLEVELNQDEFLKERVSPIQIFSDNDLFKVRLIISQELDDQDNPKEGTEPHVTSYEILSNGTKLLKFSLKPDGEFKLDLINTSNELIQRVIEFEQKHQDVPDLDHNKVDESIFLYKVDRLTILPLGLARNTFKNNDQTTESDQPDLAERILLNFLDSIVNSIHTHLNNELNELEYLGPLRSYPPRIIETAEDNDPNFKAGGGFAWKRILEDKDLRDRINKWLSSEKNLRTPYSLTIKNFHTIDTLDKYYSQDIIDILEENLTGEHDPSNDVWSAAEMALQNIKQYEDKISARKELVLTDLRSNTEVTHRDIGIGISQVLPVLVSSLGYEGKTVAIEQPEIHLHPTLQSTIAKVFIEGFKEKGNDFIIETHSEHLIKALQVEVAKWANSKGEIGISPENISILYVTKNHKEHDGALVKEMKLDNNGSFIEPWPDDFFEQSNQLTLERLKQLNK